jgi:hypothetical protein
LAGVDVCEKLTRTGKRSHLLEEPGLEYVSLRLAKLVLRCLIRIAQKRGHEHINAFGELVMNDLALEPGSDPGKSFFPREYVQIVAVDQCAIDVEENGSMGIV